jgi:predicted ATPase
LRLGKLDEAEQHHAEALDLLLDLGDSRGQAQAYIDLGDDSLARENYGAAREHCLRGVRLACGIASTHLQDFALLGCARAEFGCLNRLLAAKVVRFLLDSVAVKEESAFLFLALELRADVAVAPLCTLDELLDEITRSSGSGSLKF